MSNLAKRIKLYYEKGLYTEKQVMDFYEKGKITKNELDWILGEWLPRVN